MDFAVCPSCGQSVLDDDADDCPFCGASMKAKPGTKPSPKPAAAPAKPTVGKPASPGKPATGTPGTKGADKSAGDDYPFDAEMAQASDAIPATPNPSKARTLAVKCPMCETTGYVPASAAGKMVRCASAECLVPTFRAPAPEAPKVAPPPPPPKRNLAVLGIVTAVVVAVIGGGIYVAVSMMGPAAPVARPLTPEDIAAMKKSGTNPTTNDPTTKTKTNVPDVPTADPAVAKAAADAARREAMLKLMNESTLLSGNQNRSKPLCRRWIAESFALVGQIPQAREQINQLAVVGREVPFYRVIPWVEVARAETNATNSKAALDQAVAEAAALPKFGRDRLETAAQLAATLAIANRVPEAHTVLKGRQSNDFDGQFAYTLTYFTTDRRLVDLEQFLRLQPALPYDAPQMTATAAACVLLGHPEAAVAFAKGATDPLPHRDALVGWIVAQGFARKSLPTIPAIESASAGLDPAYRADLLARAARIAVASGATEASGPYLKAAQALTDAFPPADQFTLPELRGLLKWKPTSLTEPMAMAAASAELAIAYHEAGDSAAAQKALDQFLSITRSLGPSVPSAAALLQEMETAGPNLMRDKLKRELELRNDDEARQQFGVYRRVINDLNAAAGTRFQLQTTGLARIAAAGLEGPVWTVVSRRTGEAKPQEQEPYFTTDVPRILLHRFQVTKATEAAAALTAAYRDTTKKPLTLTLTNQAWEQLRAGDFEAAKATLAEPELKGDPAEQLLFRAAVYHAAQPDLANFWKFIAAQDSAVREICLFWGGLVLGRRDAVAAGWAQVDSFSSATEKTALCRGLIGGDVSRK